MPSYSGIWPITAALQAKGAANWPAGPAIEVGADATFKASAQLIKTNSWPLTTTKAIISYHDYTNDGLYAVVATLSGTTLTYGTPVLVKATFSPYGSSIVALDSTKALIAYETTIGGNYLGMKVLSISGTTITVGTEVNNGVTSQYPALAPLTSTTALCVYSGGNAVVISVSGTTPSFGTVVDATGSVNSTISVFALSSTSAVMFRDDSSNSNYPTVNIMTISGTTITMGTNYVIESVGISTGGGYAGVAATSSTSAIAVWKTAAGSELTKAVAMTISGTTPTFGTPITLGSVALGASQNQPITTVSSTQAIHAYSGGAYVLTASGTTLFASLPQDTAAGGGSSIAQVNGKISVRPHLIGVTAGAAQVITVL